MEKENIKSTLICKYKKLEDKPIFQKKQCEKGWEDTVYTLEDEIIFVEKGSIYMQIGQFPNITLAEHAIMMLPAGYNLSMTAMQDTEIISARLTLDVDFCECFTSHSLLNEKEVKKKYIPVYIKYNEEISLYLKSIRWYIEENIRCPGFSTLKIRELFFILAHTFSQKELLEFLYFYLSADISFSKRVRKIHTQVKNVSELASEMNYSLSGFQKHFKKVFNMSPSQWLAIQKSRLVYHDLIKNEPIKLICEKYNFSSLGHFNTFCLKCFGESPRKIQKDNN